MNTLPVTEPRRASLLVIWGVWISPASRGTMKPRTLPRTPFSTVVAQIMKKSPYGAFVIHVFWPLITHPPSFFVAVVSMLDGSEPWFGSVRPKHPRMSALARPGRYCSFWASEPNWLMAVMTRELWTDIAERNPESALPSATNSSKGAAPSAPLLLPKGLSKTTHRSTSRMMRPYET